MLAGLWEARDQQENEIPYVFPNRKGMGRVGDFLASAQT